MAKKWLGIVKIKEWMYIIIPLEAWIWKTRNKKRQSYVECGQTRHFFNVLFYPLKMKFE